MKVIGLTSGGCIIEASIQEVSSMSGVKFRNGSYDYSSNPIMEVGREFNVMEGFRQIHRNEQRQREIATVRQQLTAIITQLDMVEPFMKEPKLQEQEGTEG